MSRHLNNHFGRVFSSRTLHHTDLREFLQLQFERCVIGWYCIRENGTMGVSRLRRSGIAELHATVQWKHVFDLWSSKKLSSCDHEPWGRKTTVHATVYGAHWCCNFCSWLWIKCLKWATMFIKHHGNLWFKHSVIHIYYEPGYKLHE